MHSPDQTSHLLGSMRRAAPLQLRNVFNAPPDSDACASTSHVRKRASCPYNVRTAPTDSDADHLNADLIDG